ncbi:hypothetical protein GCM10007383_31040 [Arenibacter certesii]|uniref:Peptidase M10 metallopeptidase domain-containing protein n=1 Tax=Arenibacter certesii TaxID=228955 RepID=A0A918J391_9FLAO|nr:hypothetical protein GCM10007383_31040 [Arenibacter certesii]
MKQLTEIELKFDAPNQGKLNQHILAEISKATKTSKGGGEIKELALASDQFETINKKLKPFGMALLKVEAMSNRVPIVIFDKQFELVLEYTSWVKDDPRRGNGKNVSYNVFEPLSYANGSIPTEAISDDAYMNWGNSRCGKASIIKEPNLDTFNSAILSIGGEAGNPFTDINILGHVPGFVFGFIDGLDPKSTLGVTFSFIFVDEEGNPTDIDNDGKADTSLKEVWFNDDFLWTDTPSTNPGIDLASVLTHEIGHTLEAGHFGVGFLNLRAEGSVNYFPRAVMNAYYYEPIHNLRRTDKASYCITFGDWH